MKRLLKYVAKKASLNVNSYASIADFETLLSGSWRDDNLDLNSEFSLQHEEEGKEALKIPWKWRSNWTCENMNVEGFFGSSVVLSDRIITTLAPFNRVVPGFSVLEVLESEVAVLTLDNNTLFSTWNQFEFASGGPSDNNIPFEFPGVGVALSTHADTFEGDWNMNDLSWKSSVYYENEAMGIREWSTGETVLDESLLRVTPLPSGVYRMVWNPSNCGQWNEWEGFAYEIGNARYGVAAGLPQYTHQRGLRSVDLDLSCIDDGVLQGVLYQMDKDDAYEAIEVCLKKV